MLILDKRNNIIKLKIFIKCKTSSNSNNNIASYFYGDIVFFLFEVK